MPSTATHAMPSTATRPSRWNFRVAPDADAVVRQAAAMCSRDLTGFVVQAAMNEAERILADRTRFVLDPAEWDRFNEALERPAHKNPRLARLFSRPSVFE